MSVYGRNWCDIVCKNDYVGLRVNEIHCVMKKWIVYLYLKKWLMYGKGIMDVFNIDSVLHIINDICTN